MSSTYIPPTTAAQGARIIGEGLSDTSGPGPELMTASTLTGDKVVNTADETLGKIEEIMLDVPGGRIAYAVMSSGGFLGLGEKLFAIPWGALTLDTNRQCFVLDARAETFEDAPGFDKDHWPTQAGDLQWHRDVHAHYGLPVDPAGGTLR
ncbi:PRC-barrel domain-containing protein [Sphaerotilus uruguayifluvii]|uniref:Sporulation protein YlmC with PRC-barrel domain n=1 Tax=Sphaerotilus uruguayifluvii TaxID=2735897 RepID=A0ABX2G8T5_9BURK|nr:PRC-barrel domain-containing protein [Leptothrix sp. C29]NRT57834.1 sporulation protein YlmC with PRC-barrel domain [Leptothrix sp. C29]